MDRQKTETESGENFLIPVKTLGQQFKDCLLKLHPEFKLGVDISHMNQDFMDGFIRKGIDEVLVGKVIAYMFSDKRQADLILNSPYLKNKNKPHWSLITGWRHWLARYVHSSEQVRPEPLFNLRPQLVKKEFKPVSKADCLEMMRGLGNLGRNPWSPYWVERWQRCGFTNEELLAICETIPIKGLQASLGQALASLESALPIEEQYEWQSYREEMKPVYRNLSLMDLHDLKEGKISKERALELLPQAERMLQSNTKEPGRFVYEAVVMAHRGESYAALMEKHRTYTYKDHNKT